MKHIRITVYPRAGLPWSLDVIARSTSAAIVSMMEALGGGVILTARVVRT